MSSFFARYEPGECEPTFRRAESSGALRRVSNAARAGRRLLLSIGAAGVAALALLGCASRPLALDAPADLSGPKSVRAYVVSHGWHTGLVLPAGGLNAALPQWATRFGTPAYYEVGWGDKGFYQAPEVTVGLALQAMFWSSGSVVHVVGLPQPPDVFFPGSRSLALCLAPAQVEQLQKFIASSIVHDDAGRLVTLGQGLYGDSQFYGGVGFYSFTNTCNSWTAKGLKSAGFEIAPSLELTAGSVMRFVQKHAADGPCEAR